MSDNPTDVKALVDGLVFINEADNALEDERKGWFNSLLAGAIQCGDHTLMFSLIEDGYKERTGDTSMPSTYRSAKTVVGKAISLGIDVYDESMNFKGKTRLERDIRERERADAVLSSDTGQDKDAPKSKSLEDLKREFSEWYGAAVLKCSGGGEINELDDYISERLY